jgi:hypothetical protein
MGIVGGKIFSFFHVQQGFGFFVETGNIEKLSNLIEPNTVTYLRQHPYHQVGE